MQRRGGVHSHEIRRRLREVSQGNSGDSWGLPGQVMIGDGEGERAGSAAYVLFCYVDLYCIHRCVKLFLPV